MTTGESVGRGGDWADGGRRQPAASPFPLLILDTPSPGDSMEVVHDERQSRFTISLDGHVAELQYRRLPDGVLDLLHTGVPDALQGRGVGNALAVAAFDYVRANELRVVLTCPFLRRWILSHPDQRELVLWKRDQ